MEGINAVLSKSGKANQITQNFFETLAENGRLNQTTKVIASFEELMSAHRNELPLVVTSAKVNEKKIIYTYQVGLKDKEGNSILI